MLRIPVAPHVFLMRLAWAELLLALLQLFHLSVLSLADAADYAAWAGVHGMAQLTLWLLRRSATGCRSYPPIPWRPLLVLLLLTCCVKLFSRMTYVNAWLADGLQAARMSAEDQHVEAGLASYVNIFFYPLAILAAVTIMPRRAYRAALVVVLAVSSVDLIFIGTRNAPMFVLLFHVLLSSVRLRGRQMAALATLLVGFVGIFGYSTVNRTADEAAGNFDWLVLFEYTKSAEVLHLDNRVVAPLAEAMPAALPAVFLSHYLTHSVAELAYLVERLPQLRTGEAHHFFYQLCVSRLCSQAEQLDAIERTNPRAGVYQTIWGSLVLDFGVAGALLAWWLVIGLVALGQRLQPRTITLGVAVASQVVMLGGIENYLYNGLGLLQVMCIFVASRGLRMLGRAERASSSRTLGPAGA